MPFINVKTNQKLNADKMQAMKSQLGQAITAIPSKSEGWLMVGIQDDCNLYFKGNDAPAAMVQVSLYGNASSNALTTLTSHITGILQAEANVPAERVYVSYMSTNEWGWNGVNF